MFFLPVFYETIIQKSEEKRFTDGGYQISIQSWKLEI